MPIFLMTFGICMFIVLMQFLWKYVDEMVGKGLEISVLLEMFFYAALSLVPMALPLAILLASLMTFGNLGEQLELLAMKSAGISLPRIMRPFIILLSFVAVGAFFFQNNIIPLSQVKMWTLLGSIRAKSPELQIPESTFSNQIEGYNLYVNGGTFVAVGGGTTYPASSSKQPSIVYGGSVASGTTLALNSSSANILTFEMGRSYNGTAVFLISSPSLSTGNSYTISSGATATGTDWHGLITEATLSSAGSTVATISSLTSPYSSVGSSTGGMGGNGGRRW